MVRQRRTGRPRCTAARSKRVQRAIWAEACSARAGSAAGAAAAHLRRTAPPQPRSTLCRGRWSASGRPARPPQRAARALLAGGRAGRGTRWGRRGRWGDQLGGSRRVAGEASGQEHMRAGAAVGGAATPHQRKGSKGSKGGRSSKAREAHLVPRGWQCQADAASAPQTPPAPAAPGSAQSAGGQAGEGRSAAVRGQGSRGQG